MIRIAIVDDKPIVRKAIRDKLSVNPELYICFEASNGHDFLNKINEIKNGLPEIILMDIEMPEMDGIHAISLGSAAYPEMKFIVLSVFDNTEKIFEAIKAGANGYLLKDDDAVNLNEAILQVANYNAVPMSPAIARKTLGLLKSVLPNVPKEKNSEILSSREHIVLQQMVEGLDYKQIAEKLYISPATVRTHIANIYQKLHVKSKAQAIKFANKNRWV